MDDKPKFSIVVSTYDQAQEISENLPSLLNQQYEAGYEVIVVDESSADDTADVLKQLKSQFPNLYTTFLPKYQFQKNRQRLAYTIGVKAAKHNYTVLADINRPPLSETWLQDLAEVIESQRPELMAGYIIRKKGTMKLQTFDDIAQAQHIVGKAERRKANGHKGRWLRFLRGKYDFLVVKTSLGHELLRFFETDLKGTNLLGCRLKVILHNMME